MPAEKPTKIFVVHDNSYRAVQALEVAGKFKDIELNRRIFITCGREVVDKAMAAKKADDVLVSMLDPGREYEKFDLIFVPEHDPHPELLNMRTTVGLINHVTPELIKNAYLELDSGSPHRILNQVQDIHFGYKVISVLIGGRHVGGNFSADDAEQLAEILNSSGHYPLITTSKRTEEKAVAALRESLRVPYYIYEYNKDGQAANPYLRILAAAEKIIVTTDSVRMCSEAASSGKQVFIFTPEQTHFSYLSLRDSFFTHGAALPVNNLLDNTPTKTLNEAKRVADIILEVANGGKI